MRLMLDSDPSPTAAEQNSAGAFELSESEWVALRSGDNATRRRVFLRFVDVLRLAVRGWVHGIQREDADDIVSETFFRAFKNIGSVRAAEQFEGWLFGLARNVAMDFCRRQGRSIKQLSLEDLSPTAREQALRAASEADAASVLAQLESREDRGVLSALVQQVLAELPARQQQALLDRYRDGKTLSEIAAAQHIAEDAAGSLLYRARMAFREKFQKRRKSEVSHE